jgi:hypothetical protein
MLHFGCNVETLKNAMISVFQPHWLHEIILCHYALPKTCSLLHPWCQHMLLLLLSFSFLFFFFFFLA